MRQNTLKWLSCSLTLLIILSCKKEKGILDDVETGRFDHVFIWNLNGVQDTLTGEVSGPYMQGGAFVFRVRKELMPTNTDFRIGRAKNPTMFTASDLPYTLTCPVISCDHDSDHLWLTFERGDTITGSFELTRKE